MLRSRVLLAAVGVILLVGCGDRNLVLKVDVLSYLDPQMTQVAVGPIPPTPGGFVSGEQEVLSQDINLVDGMSSVAEVQGISISMSAEVADSTGSGADTLRLYLSDPAVNPRSTAPVMVVPITLTPGVTDTVAVSVGGDTRVADLFTQKRLRLTMTTSFRGPSSGPDLNARLKMLSLEAVLVAGRKSL